MMVTGLRTANFVRLTIPYSPAFSDSEAAVSGAAASWVEVSVSSV